VLSDETDWLLQVRGVSFPDPSSLLSASRDATVRLWKLQKDTPPTFDDTIIAHGGSFMSTVALIPSSPEFPDGLVATGSRDGLIDLRSPKSTPDQVPAALLIGHGNNVCALDVSEDGKFLVSGSWDASARLWEVGKWGPDQAIVLSGHELTVWAVLALNTKVIVTGTASARPPCNSHS
jgi:phospholipase A-2-activating protein